MPDYSSRTALLACALLLAGCGGGKTLVPGRIVVSFDQEVSESAASRIIENNGLATAGEICIKSRRLIPFSRQTALDVAVPFGQENMWRARLKRIPGVEDAKPCYERIQE